MTPMVYSGAREKPIHEKKNLKSKISCQTPFNNNNNVKSTRYRTPS
jgi:hypothetical protein